MTYLRPFLSREGAFVLLVIALSFGCSLYWMSQIARVDVPGRLLAHRAGAKS